MERPYQPYLVAGAALVQDDEFHQVRISCATLNTALLLEIGHFPLQCL